MGRVVDFLHKNKYQKVDFISSPGDFVVRGGVLDIYSYDSSFPFRAGFFGGDGSVLYFNSSTGNIIKKTKRALVAPLPQKRRILLKDLDYFNILFIIKGVFFLFLTKNLLLTVLFYVALFLLFLIFSLKKIKIFLHTFFLITFFLAAVFITVFFIFLFGFLGTFL